MPQSQHSHSTVTAQSRHSHGTAQSRHSHTVTSSCVHVQSVDPVICGRVGLQQGSDRQPAADGGWTVQHCCDQASPSPLLPFSPSPRPPRRPGLPVSPLDALLETPPLGHYGAASSVRASSRKPAAGGERSPRAHCLPCHTHSTVVMAQSQHSHSTVMTQSRHVKHSHSTVTAQSQSHCLPCHTHSTVTAQS